MSAETSKAGHGGTYQPDPTWAPDQDLSPRPVPEADADGNEWRITGDGRHVGTHNGDTYCLEWLPVHADRQPDFGPREGLEPEREAEAG